VHYEVLKTKFVHIVITETEELNEAMKLVLVEWFY